MTTEDKIAKLADDAERVERFPDGYDYDQVLSALSKLLRAYRASELLREAEGCNGSYEGPKRDYLRAQADQLVSEVGDE